MPDQKTIVVLGTLDTKGPEMDYCKQLVEARGHKALVVDVSVVGQPAFAADVAREEVAQDGGKSLAELLEAGSREVAAPVMAGGATRIVTSLAAEGKAHGILSMGGTQGTTLATTVMQALPVGFPKVMVSTMASGDTRPFVDIKDITMMFSVADIMGLNRVSSQILANAVGAVCGMAETEVPSDQETRPLVALTTVGITTTGALKAIEVLKEEGFDVIVFHAVGTGGRAMEALVKEGAVAGVLDLSTIEVSNELHDAMLAATPERLTVAAKAGIPTVLCPGAVEVLVFGRPETVPERYQGRTLIPHSPLITDVRLNKEEMIHVAKEQAERVNEATGPTEWFVPTRGFDSYAVEGEGFWDPEADGAYLETLQARTRSDIPVHVRDTDINDPEFATEVARRLATMLREAGAT